MSRVDKARIPAELDKRRKLAAETKEQILAEYNEGNISQNALAKKYGIDRKTVTAIVNPQYAEKRKEYMREYHKARPRTERDNANVRRCKERKRRLLEQGLIGEPNA